MNREEIILKDFLKDSKEYIECVQIWAKEIRSIDIEIGERNKYITDKNGDNLFFNDGNPIFNNINLIRGRAFRIIQESPIELEKYSDYEINKINLIEGWISRTNITINGSDMELDELVISLFLTPESIRKVKLIVKKWYSEINSKDFIIEKYL